MKLNDDQRHADESDGAETRRRCYATTPGLLEMKETDTLDPALLLWTVQRLHGRPLLLFFFSFFFTASQSEDSDVHVELEN